MFIDLRERRRGGERGREREASMWQGTLTDQLPPVHVRLGSNPPVVRAHTPSPWSHEARVGVDVLNRDTEGFTPKLACDGSEKIGLYHIAG